MNDFDSQYTQGRPTVQDMALDLGLRNFMLGIYQKMALGLALTGVLAWTVANVPAISNLMFQVSSTGRFSYTLLGTVISFAPLVVLLGSGFVMRAPTAASTGILYWLVVSLIGLSLGAVFLLYTGLSLASTFFATAAAFGALSIVGYTTKKNLSGMGTFLHMAIWGILIASIANIFMQSAMIYYITSAIGIVVMAGFIAFHTQMLKGIYYSLGGNQTQMAMATNYGALALYIDFVNMFQFLLAFIGVRRD